MKSYCYFIAASWGKNAISEDFQALARKLTERGHRVIYLTYSSKLPLENPDFPVLSFPSPRPTKIRDFIFLHHLIRKHRPDCMIANFGAVNVMTIMGWLNRVPYRINWYHTLSKQLEIDSTNPLKSKFQGWRKRLVYQLATQIIANSNSTRDDVLEKYKLNPNKVITFYYSLIDINISQQRKNEAMLCAGRFDLSKGQDVLFHAMAFLKDEFPTLHLNLLGGGKLETRYKSLIAELGLSNNVTFHGAVSHQDVLLAMASAVFTVVPSRSEAFGLVNIESMAVGTPVIASAVGGIPEIIRDGVDGFLVPPDDPQALAEKIKMLYTNQALREKMGQNARQRFLDVFEQTRNIESQILWLESIVQQYR